MKLTIASVKRVVSRANPDAKNLAVKWASQPRKAKCFDGTPGIWRDVIVSGDGFRTKRMTASLDSMGLMVR